MEEALDLSSDRLLNNNNSVIFSLKQVLFLFATFLPERSGDADVQAVLYVTNTIPVRLPYHNSCTQRNSRPGTLDRHKA